MKKNLRKYSRKQKTQREMGTGESREEWKKIEENKKEKEEIKEGPQLLVIWRSILIIFSHGSPAFPNDFFTFRVHDQNFVKIYPTSRACHMLIQSHSVQQYFVKCGNFVTYFVIFSHFLSLPFTSQHSPSTGWTPTVCQQTTIHTRARARAYTHTHTHTQTRARAAHTEAKGIDVSFRENVHLMFHVSYTAISGYGNITWV